MWIESKDAQYCLKRQESNQTITHHKKIMPIGKEYMKFSDVYRAKLHWSDRCGFHGNNQPKWLIRQQTDGILFWASIIACKIIDAFKVDDNDAIKMNALKYSKFFDKMFFDWL